MQLIHKEEFTNLFQEFIDTFVHTPKGQEHIDFYAHNREIGRKNFEEIKAAFEEQHISSAGQMSEELTDQVLKKLLPHTDSVNHREQGVWIHHAPAIAGDIRSWYEADGSAWEWREIAHAIFHFITSCLEQNYDLQTICQSFDGLPHTKRLQSGMLTPILNAVWPEEFLLINSKSQKTIGYFAGTKCSSKLVDYPKVNERGKRLIQQLVSIMQSLWASDLSYQDQFDMFCHWLMAIKRHPLIPTRYWKIVPGENPWQWEECRDQGFITLGWQGKEFGDLSDLTKHQFDQRVKDVLASDAATRLSKTGVQQLWHFSHIQEGDRIVVNRDTREVLGIGTVTGPYYYQENTPSSSHRLPVRWDDLTVRSVTVQSADKFGGRRALVKLDQETFDKVQKARVQKPRLQELDLEPMISSSTMPEGELAEVNPGCPFDEKTFDLLSKLHATPKKTVYDDHKQEFKSHLTEPFQRLMLEVTKHLPTSIRDLMETRSGIFGRILKNDFGHGGAYEHYWGAFYPKGMKKTEGAQLILIIGYDRLNFGFDIGHYSGEQRERFLENCRKHYESLCELLEAPLNQPHFFFGDQGNVKYDSDGNSVNPDHLSFRDWLGQVSSKDVHVFTTLSKTRVLSSSRDELVNDISKVFSQLFPLVLLATLDDPMPALQEYLEIGGEDDESLIELNETYTLSQCAKDTHLEESLLEDWVQALNRKSQAILYGPPGTGKTYLAEHIAQHLLSDGDGFMEIVQFHPAYTYEDFIQGIRPRQGKNGGLDYPIEPGRFLTFCQEARQRQSICVLIIDEINRANLAQVFGELMYLLEYRDKEVKLACGGQRFSIPKNVRIIGTMNTADRSIALVDHALRRRFAFLPLYPQMDVLRHFHVSTGFYVEGLINVLKRVNKTIDDPQYAIGTSFFLHESLQTELRAIWRMEIEPYLEEYFFDQPQKIEEFRWERVKQELMP